MSTQLEFDEKAFFDRFKKRFPEGEMDDDDRSDLMALIVDDDVPLEVRLSPNI